MKLFFEQNLDEEYVGGKLYIFRGESKNDFQSNYHYRNKFPFTSRYYSYELYDDIYAFGNVVAFEVLDESRLFQYEDSSEEFCNEYDLLDYESKYLKEAYGIDKLSDMSSLGGDVDLDYHDEYHSYQLIATEYLETNMKNKYAGIVWYESNDTPEYQLQIWDSSILRKLKPSEFKNWIREFVKEYPSSKDMIYDKDWKADSSLKWKFNIKGAKQGYLDDLEDIMKD